MDFVVLEMVRQLQQIDKENEYYILVAPGPDRCLQETANFHVVEVKCPTYPLWEQVALPMAVKRIKPDLLHCTSNTAPICCNVPLVLTLHDIIFLEPREQKAKSLYQNMGWYYRKWVVPRILSKCRRIITVSQFERDNILSKTHCLPEQVVAVYNGFSQHFQPVQDWQPTVAKYIDTENYFFFLGNTDPKKNTRRVLKAYSLFRQQMPMSAGALPKLLVADLKADILRGYCEELGIGSLYGKEIVPSGYIDNRDLPSIYSGAKTFIYTSLRESFGIPLLEGMACGTPVITSNTSALPEVAGEGAVMVDPYDEQAMADVLIRMVSDESYRAEVIAYGLKRCSQFSWRSTAENVRLLYSQVCAGR